MTVEQIMTELEYLTWGELPREALTAAMAQQEAITPALLHLLENPDALLERMLEEEDYMMPFYAMYLLAYFREPRAYPLIVDFFAIPGREVVDATGDMVTEDLGRILASVAHGNLEGIQQLIEDPNVNEWVRSAGIEAMIVQVVQDEVPREDVQAYFAELFHTKLEDETGVVWENLIIATAELQFTSLTHEIEEAFAEHVIDELIINLAELKQEMNRDQEEQQHKQQRDQHNQLIQDTITEMAWWSCFREKPKPLKEPRVPQQPLPYIAPVKVGRNDPCPCGSGKKYKYCCGARH
jgi:uncharacterized protein YecA (UPF0149 family)